MDERTAALEGFITLVQTNKGKACQMVIQQVLKDPKIYVFGELLSEPNVQELEKMADLKPWLDLLKIFAYGTYQDYKASSQKLKLPELKDQALTKLKLLTIVSFAAQRKILPYDLLQKELDIANVRDLEDLIIDCCYQGLIKGKLDQKKAAFEVASSIGRDIGPTDVDEMIKKLQNWLDTSNTLIEHLDKKIIEANEEKAKEKQDEEELAKEKKGLMEAIKLEKDQQGQGQQGPGGPSSQMAGGVMGAMFSQMAGLMGLDEREGRSSRPHKRRGPGGQRGPFGGRRG
jgi:COP9 signalosome complex subunit 7